MRLVIDEVKTIAVLPRGSDPATGDATHTRTINIDSEHGMLAIELRSGLPDNLTPLMIGNPPAIDALHALIRVIEAAGLNNLANGVQLGQVSWLVKANDAMAEGRRALMGTTAPTVAINA